MKQIIRNISKQHIIVFALLLVIALAIWFEGPLLTIANHQPLYETSKRLFLVITLFLLAGLVKWILTPPTHVETQYKANPDSSNHLHILKGRFEGAIHFLKKTIIHHRGKANALSKLPWYLMIGPSHSGKTSLLAYSTINYTLTKQFKNDEIIPSDNCDWWATKELVIVDVPSFYLKPSEGYLRNQFIKLLKKYRGTHGVNGIIIALPLPELTKKQTIQQKKQTIAEIKNAITELHKQFSDQIPIYVVITKCDLIPGFLEFFSEAGTEELAQAWGITLPAVNEHETIHELFLQRFNALIKKLNSQLISHLHTERNPNNRPAIKDFPLQIERLKENIAHFLKALSIKHLYLHGVYLTSSTQPTDDTKPAQSQLINPGNHQALQLLRSPAMPSKGFFIRQMILQGLLWTGDQAAPVYEEAWKRKTTYGLSVAIFMLAIFLLGRDFQHSVFLTYALQNDLAQYQTTLKQRTHDKNEYLRTLPLLNALKSRVTESTSLLSRLTHLSYYSSRSQQAINGMYTQALQTLILPAIKSNLEGYLKNPSTIDSSQLYAVLQAYLMLGDSQHVRPDYIVKTLQQLNSKVFDSVNSQELLIHLNQAFKSTPPVILDNKLISQIRSLLANLPKLDLGFIILKNINNNGSLVSSDMDTSIFLTNQTLETTPVLFTGEKFATVLTHDIPFAAKEALQGNWILGSLQTEPSEAELESFNDQLHARYIASYVDLWENKLLNTKLANPTSLAETDAMISSITSNTSPLLTLLKNIKQNTSFAPVLKASQKLAALNNLLANAHSEQENTLYEIFVSLRKLHFHLETILNANEIGVAAFEVAKTRIQTASGDPISMVHLLAQQNPEPLRSWLNNLANLSWYFILGEASRHIENEWQLNVATIYRSQIANHFPMDPNSNQEVDMQQFISFAGKEGTLIKFYDRYLKPFIADETNQWQWKAVDNQRLPFNPMVLTQLQQAFKVQNISKYTLFTQGQKNPALMRFQLPTSLIDKMS